MTTMRRTRWSTTACAGWRRPRHTEEHVEAALAEAGDEEVAVRDVLERLGPPEEIAAAGVAPERGRLETAALIVLSVSFVLPGFGYLIGAGLVLASKAWDGREKTIGLLIPPLVVLVGAIVLLAGSASVAEGDSFDSGPGPAEIAVLAVNFLSGLVAAAYLSSRLNRATAG
jgi:hypothetical protein